MYWKRLEDYMPEATIDENGVIECGTWSMKER
jgi:hypothetical protein